MTHPTQHREAQGLRTESLLTPSFASQDHIINIQYAAALDIDTDANANAEMIGEIYAASTLQKVVSAALQHMDKKAQSGIAFPYFAALEADMWTTKPKELDVYITDAAEAKALNLASRGKDYATNILSYPSDLPTPVLQAMPTIPLGELIICHAVVVVQAAEQNKPVGEHATHLLVHGILHLLGFDHEQGDAAADAMEEFEVDILQRLGVSNPYLLR